MSKFLCRCGSIVKTSGDIPNPAEMLLISDERFDAFSGAVDSEEPYAAFTRAFVCASCGTTWVFKEGLDAPPTGYVPISPE